MLYLNDHISNLDIESALGLLPPERIEHVLSYRRISDRRQHVAAWLLLRHGLLKEYGLAEVPPLAYGPSGKPFFPTHPHIHFNLSHCSEGAICALSCEAVGVDIERIRTYDEKLAQYTMNEQEMQEINASADPATSFIRFWTMKEAVLKCDGSGIRNDMRGVLSGNEPLTTVVSADCRYVYSVCGWGNDISPCHPCLFP